MVSRRVASRARRYSAAIVALVAATATALMAASCAWPAADIFPDWLPYVDGRADLSAAAADAKIGTLSNLETVKYVPFSNAGVDTSKVLAYLRGREGEALVAFNPAGMGLAQTWKKASAAEELLYALRPPIIKSPDGFIAGNLAFSMSDLAADPEQLPGGFPQGGIVLALGSPVYYYLVQVRYDDTTLTNWLEMQVFNEDFTTVTPTMRKLELPGIVNGLAGAEYFGSADPSDGTFRLLASADTGMYVVSFKRDAGLILAADAPVITGPIPMSDGRAWLTVDGVVAQFRNNEQDRNGLARYAYGTTVAAGSLATPVDEIEFTGDTEYYQIMSFDASGERWFLYDRLRQLLYSMRTWW